MELDTTLERLYEQVQLIRGVGSRNKGRLCVMSFVSWLAGEPHSDDPATASPIIRRFALTINDEMPDPVRPRLKPFAPRIVGTRDGQDAARARLLLDAAQQDLMPAIAFEFGPYLLIRHRTPCSQKKGCLRDSHARVTQLIASAMEADAVPSCDETASAIALLIARCAHRARDVGALNREEWYWGRAIAYLDAMCAISAGTPKISCERLRAITSSLHESRSAPRGRGAGFISHIRSLMPSYVN